MNPYRKFPLVSAISWIYYRQTRETRKLLAKFPNHSLTDDEMRCIYESVEYPWFCVDAFGKGLRLDKVEKLWSIYHKEPLFTLKLATSLWEQIDAVPKSSSDRVRKWFLHDGYWEFIEGTEVEGMTVGNQSGEVFDVPPSLDESGNFITRPDRGEGISDVELAEKLKVELQDRGITAKVVERVREDLYCLASKSSPSSR
jgi:hypothetical protein